MPRVSALGTWLTAAVAEHPEGLTAKDLHALALARTATRPALVDVAGQLAVLEQDGRVVAGPWTYSDGRPAPRGSGRCVRKWYPPGADIPPTPKRDTLKLVKDTDQ